MAAIYPEPDPYAPKCGSICEGDRIVSISTWVMPGKISGIQLLEPSCDSQRNEMVNKAFCVCVCVPVSISTLTCILVC